MNVAFPVNTNSVSFRQDTQVLYYTLQMVLRIHLDVTVFKLCQEGCMFDISPLDSFYFGTRLFLFIMPKL